MMPPIPSPFMDALWWFAERAHIIATIGFLFWMLVIGATDWFANWYLERKTK